MRQIYSLVILLISAMMMFFYRFVEKNERTAVTKSIKKLFLSAILTSVLYAAAIVINSETGAVACYGYYFAASDFLILSLLCFIEKYADIKRKSGAAERIFYAGAIADTLSMTVNIFNQNVFACEAVETQSGAVFYHIYSIGVLYIIHRIFIIMLIALAISILLYKFVNAPMIHKKKYLVILILFSVAVALDIVSLVLQLPVDLSLAAYGAVAFGIYYFAVIYIPHDLVEQLLANAVRSMDDGVMCYDGNGRCVYINDIILKSIQNRNIQEIKDTFLAEYTAENPDRNEEMSVKKVLLNENDEKRFLDISYKALLDQNGEYLGCFFVFHDETEEILKFKRERYRITHDKLTDLYNREHFYEKVRELLEYAANDEYYMICCDIKDFKLVNDVFGMKKGDELLINIANRLRKLENGLDRAVYGRMSGDRFAVCISKRRYNEELFIREVQKLGEVSENKSYHVYIHMGVFPISDPALEVSVMCDRAFMAINSIKDSYTEVVAYYDEKLRESRIHEKQITSQFNDAIRNGQFKMFLQPQIDTKGKLKGAEALVRWYHPEQGVIPPLEFIGIFEKSGLIGTLDHHIWELACQQLKKWKAEGKGEYHISVNISPKDFYFMNIYDIFTGLVEKYDIDPVKLKLEITETAIMSDAKNQLALIDRLREYGFEVEIDDFGSGYSSLSMLKEMNVDVLKVDMGFLEKTDNLEKSRAILGTIIDLAKHLGMEVVTEGVETEDQVNFLREAGCDIFQGYYFDRPMQVDDFENKYFSK